MSAPPHRLAWVLNLDADLELAAPPGYLPRQTIKEALATFVPVLARVAVALAGSGYFGPFGIDAFTYRNADGTVALQPRSEINARYSMGFAIGFPAGLR